MNKRKKCVKKTIIQFDDFCTHFAMTDKESYKICLPMLEKLYNEALNANKRPLLVLGVRRNDREVFTLTAELSIEIQKCSKRK